MRNRSLSLTGATGFLGWHLAEAFRNAGWEVRGIVRPGNRKPLPDGVQPVEAPLTDTSRLFAAIHGSEMLLHAAALIRAPTDAAFTAVNVDGTRTAVDAANLAGAQLMLISSQAAGGTGSRTRPRREDDPPQPVNAYGRSKLASETIVRATARTRWTIVRPCAVYGPRDRGFLPLFRMAKRGLFILPADPATLFTFIFVDDLVRGVMLAASSDRAVGQTMFLGHAEPKSADDLLRTAAGVFGRPYRPRVLPRAIVRLAAAAGDVSWKLGKQPIIDRGRLAELDAEGFVCSVDRVRELTGFTASVSLTEGINRTAAWYRANRWL
jgi:nucleoside-diphosphate-sugar epimerase